MKPAFAHRLYACTVFLGAFLLFLVEPMAAKRLLPVLGGSSAVWTTCLVFFQVVLLLGYLYAHWLSSKVAFFRQGAIHTILLFLAVVSFRLHLSPYSAAISYHPALTVFWLLLALIGLPFFALSATTPLVTAWYARAYPDTSPYRFFALSSFASMLALIAYPFAIEPDFTMRQQTVLWTAGFVLFAFLSGAIAWAGLGSLLATSQAESPAQTKNGKAREALLWFLLAFGGGMMLEAVTSHLSQNIAAIPLLWLPPLALYLLSFILTFNGRLPYSRSLMPRLALISVAVLIYVLVNLRRVLPLAQSVPLMLAGLFFICYLFNGELYARRPAVGGLTRFYLLIAAGGAAGTMSVGLLAPILLRANYDLACTLVAAAFIALLAVWREGWGARMVWIAGLAGALFALRLQVVAYNEDTVSLIRNFYGSLRVKESYLPPQSGTDRQLFNGTIEHGAEWFAPEFRDRPLTYYAPESGIGLAMRFCCNGRSKRVAIIGLGTGTLASYGNGGDFFQFYEIDPLVERLAATWFTYLRDCRAQAVVTLGDARLAMAQGKPQRFDVIVVDAFSGDAIPVHLLTRQALALYRDHLQPNGVIAFHISNRFINLEPVVAGLARDAGLQVAIVNTRADDEQGYYAADWALVTANGTFLGLPEVAAAIAEPDHRSVRTWTDDYSSILPLLRWRRR